MTKSPTAKRHRSAISPALKTTATLASTSTSTAKPKMAERHYAVIGAGIAGIAAARTLV